METIHIETKQLEDIYTDEISQEIQLEFENIKSYLRSNESFSTFYNFENHQSNSTEKITLSEKEVKYKIKILKLKKAFEIY